MDATLVSGMTGVLGALVGGSATMAAAWITQRTSSRREMVRMELQKRETLYGEFINENSRLAHRRAGTWIGQTGDDVVRVRIAQPHPAFVV